MAAVEAVMAAFALVLVLRGLRASLRNNWLLERHRAERLRLLKFGALFEPSLLTAPDAEAAAWRRWLDGEIARIGEWRSAPHDGKKSATKEEREKTMEGWVEADPSLAVPHKWKGLQVPGAELLDLIKYYNMKRLEVQCAFFYDRAQRNVKLDKQTRRLPVWAFFLSVAFALLHFFLDAVEYVSAYMSGHEAAAARNCAPDLWWLIFLAAALPVVGAMFRTIRSANEYSRNNIRYNAKLTSLLLHADKLEKQTEELKAAGGGSPSASEIEDVCLELWGSEQDLEAEYREWLRLMIETEWFG